MTKADDKQAAKSEAGEKRPAMSAEHVDQLLNYRLDLIRLTESSQRDFDQRVLALSGSAFGLTFSFADRFVLANCVPLYDYLFGAFVCWTLSILAVLFSFFFSVKALDRTRDVVDEAIRTDDPKKLESANLGGWPQTVLGALNLFSGVFFICGVVLTMLFVNVNNRDECPPESRIEVAVQLPVSPN